jgi:hypothetical protein
MDAHSKTDLAETGSTLSNRQVNLVRYNDLIMADNYLFGIEHKPSSHSGVWGGERKAIAGLA